MDAAKWRKGLEQEFLFHQKNKLRMNDQAWTDSCRKLLTGMGIDLEAQGLRVLDAGCGSRLRSAVLTERNTVIGIDPLADKYMSLSFSDLNTIECYGCGLEQRLDSLLGSIDLVVCLNVLDHCYSPDRALQNLADYLKPGGELRLWTDIGHVDEVHAGDFDMEDVQKMLENCGFEIVRLTKDIDPYTFAFTNQQNYRRCGAPCQPGVSCVVAYARKPKKRVDQPLNAVATGRRRT